MSGYKIEDVGFAIESHPTWYVASDAPVFLLLPSHNSSY